jgi:hypothetical protein
VKVAEIRRLLLDGEGPDAVGAKYKVTPSNITLIKYKHSWKGIKPAKKGFANAA